MKVSKSIDKKDLRLSMIIYALTGAGKTQFCGTLEDCKATRPTLIVNVGGGPNTLAGRSIHIVSPKSLEDLQTVYDFLRNKNKRFKSVCLDGITGVQQELSMPEIQGIKAKGEPDDYKGLGDASPPDRRHWLYSGEHIKRVLRAFRDLAELEEVGRRIHVVITALEKKDDDRSAVCPELPGKLGISCGAHCDVLGRLSVQTRVKQGKPVEYRKLWTVLSVNDEGYTVVAKNRTGFLGRYVINPTMSKIYAKWMEA